MSITTKSGDSGSTALMYNRRVSKNHPQVEAYGTVDELNSALGFARATAQNPRIRDDLQRIQKELVALMGELAVAPEDQSRYAAAKYPRLQPEHVAALEAGIFWIEGLKPGLEGWATPGHSLHSAALDLARSVGRRAERRIVALQESGFAVPETTLHYLNRLSDLLWLMARLEESAGSTT